VQGSSQSRLYYVSPSGSASNPGTLDAPFLTLNRGVKVLRPGDTLSVRQGSYSEALLDAIPEGTSWSAPVTVTAYPGETVILRPTAGTSRVLMFSSSASSYIVVSGLVLDGCNVSYDAVKISWTSGRGGSAANHIRLLNCEIKNAAENNLLIDGNPNRLVDYNEILGCTIHDNRGVSDLDGAHYHGIYCTSSYNLFHGNNIYNNTGYGIHIYQSKGVSSIECSSNTVSQNQLHDNGKFGNTGSAGITASVGDGNKVINNLVWNNPRGIAVDYGASNTLIYNNTVYKNNAGNAGIDIANNGNATGTIVRNNIGYQNSRGDYKDKGTGTVQSHNLFGMNPLFVAASKGDFHLQAGSPAIGAGTTLVQVPTDYDGMKRPQYHQDQKKRTSP
jgi:parallel beta-helix repeat protein